MSGSTEIFTFSNELFYLPGGGVGPCDYSLIVNNVVPFEPPPLRLGSLHVYPFGAVSISDDGSGFAGLVYYVTYDFGTTWTLGNVSGNGTFSIPPGIGTQQFRGTITSPIGAQIRWIISWTDGLYESVLNDPPDDSPPTGIYPPSNLSASLDFDTVFFASLSWTINSDNELGFAVERSDDDGQTWTVIMSTSAGVSEFKDYNFESNSSYRVFAFKADKRSSASNIASVEFTITSVSPNQSLIGFNPTIIITGTGFGTASATQITSVHFRSRFNPIYSADATSITPIDNTHISVVVPNAPNGSEYVDVVIENLHGDTDTLLGGYHYNIQFEWTLEDPFTPVVPGSKVKFSSDNAISISPDTLGSSSVDPDSKINSDGFSNNPGFDGVVEIQLQAVGSDLPIIIVPSYNIIIQTPIKLWFYIPIGFKTFIGPVTIILVGDGIQFYGSVIAGQLQILYEDATGIYTLVQDQTSDLLYTRNGYITNIASFISPNITEDELYENDAFGMMPYPYKMLTQDDSNEDFESGDFFMTLNLQFPVLVSVEIPSPFVRTSFLP